MLADKTYLLVENGKETGPFTKSQLQERIETQQISPETVCIPKSLMGIPGPLSNFFPNIVFKPITPIQPTESEIKQKKLDPESRWNLGGFDYFGICASAIFIALGIGSGIFFGIFIVILIFRKRAYLSIKKLMSELEYVQISKIVKPRQENEMLNYPSSTKTSTTEILKDKEARIKEKGIGIPENMSMEMPQSAENLPTMVQTELFETYTVIYLGGLPEYPKSKAGQISLKAFADRFMLIPTFGTKNWLQEITISYESITDLKIVPRQVSTIESLLGGLDSRQLNQLNNIHIIYKDERGAGNLTLRLEMLSGFTVMGQAAKCLEFEDRLRTHHIRDRFRPASIASALIPIIIDIPSQIERLADLRDKGILSISEFEAKKTELLFRM